MHYYKFNIGDWHLHTSHLTLVEEAVYFRLVNHYYNTEKPFIKSETQTLIRRLRLGNESVTVDTILEEFFVLNGESYFHTRCEKEIKSFKKKAKVNKANGAKGGRPPVVKGLEDNPEETQTVTTPNPNVTLNTNHKPLTTNQEPLLKDNVAVAPVDRKKSTVPYQQIADMYNQILGAEFKAIVKLDVGTRKAKIKKFWNDMGKDMAECERYFTYFGEQAEPWQKGLTDRKWTADIEYIVKDTTVEKMRAG